MKCLCHIVILTLAIPIASFAQDPSNYHIIFGNRDGSPLDVPLGTQFPLNIWAATSAVPGEADRIICSMHDPLATNDSIIISHLGGICVSYCDSFWWPEANQPVSGFTTQSHVKMPENLQDPDCYLRTYGDTVIIGMLWVTTTHDSSYLGQTVYPLVPGSGAFIWGFSDGYTIVSPTQTYCALHFPGCTVRPGDSNNDGTFNGIDVSYSVNYLKGQGTAPPRACNCSQFGEIFAGADANGNCAFNGLDVTYSVNYLKGIGQEPQRCISCQ
jgi:hypothetical protein